jgi:hypothetical protein
MAEDLTRVNNTYSILKSTDQKLEDLKRLTYRGNKGSVIDWIVAQTYERVVNGRSDEEIAKMFSHDGKLLSD